MAITIKPKGLKIERNKNKFTFSWQIADKDYNDGQRLYWDKRISKGGTVKTGEEAKSVKIGKKTTSKSVTITPSSYYPTTSKIIKSITFYVQGNRDKYTKKGKTINPSMSELSQKTYEILPPSTPKVTQALSDVWNKCVFAWETSVSDTNQRHFVNVKWESILVKNAEGNGENYRWSAGATGWQTGTGNATGSKTITEDTFTLAEESYTRFFRVQARGCGGASEWAYTKHVYAKTNQAEVDKTKVTDTDNGQDVRVEWSADTGIAKPIDTTTVQWLIGIPLEGLQVPEGTWQDANVSADTSGKDAAVISVNQRLTADQCLWVKVNTKHDNETTEGVPTLVKKGYLALPSLGSIVTDDTTHRATVHATNASQVEDSFLIVYYRPASNPEGIPLGIIEHGETETTIQCPDWSEESGIAFGVKAFTGTYEEKTVDGLTNYVMTDLWMESKGIQWNAGEVPKPAQNVTAKPTAIRGTIRVDWDWTWTEANGAEIAWSDHEDAWESTDEPDIYTISNVKPSHWNIANLETGVTWYIRVRLFKGTGDNITYSPWSDLTTESTVDLATAPSKPMLILSESVIPQDGSVTASWVYSTTDGTDQSYAEICQGEFETGFVPTKLIAHTETAQHVTINAEEAEWETGETYNLAVRVWSASGKVSDEWSAPVSIKIAEPLVATITETSLETISVEVNPRSFSGDIIAFDTDMEEDFTKMQVSLEPIQDLHGYDRPWVGGAGKNKLPQYSKGQTVNGIVWTVNEDGSLTAKGTATERSIFYYLPNNDYGYISGSIKATMLDKNGDVIPASMDSVNSGIKIGNTWGGFNSVTMNVDGVLSQVWFSIDKLNTAIDYTIYPIVYDASLSPTPWTPYSNICPISGWDEVEVEHVGKNLWDFASLLVGITQEGDVFTFPTVSGTRPMLTFSEEDIDIVIGASSVSYTTAGSNMRVELYNSSDTLVTQITITTLNVVRNVNGVSKIRFNYGSLGTNVKVAEPMIRLASDTDPTYEPYQGKTYTTKLVENIWDEEWENGYIVASTGAVAPSTTEFVSKNFIPVSPNTDYYVVCPYTGANRIAMYDENQNWIGSTGWGVFQTGLRTMPSNVYYIKFYCTGSTYNNDIRIYYAPMPDGYVYGGTVDLVSGELVIDRAMVTLDGSADEGWSVGTKATHYRGYTYALSDIKSHSQNAQPTSAICDKIPTGTWNNAFGGVLAIGQTGKAIGFGLDSLGITNYTDLNEWLSNNPITICYPLATPQTYQLDPQTIETLVGQNNLATDGTLAVRISESYKDVLALTEMPLTVTVEGAGEGGETILAIERAESYHNGKPDETEYNGYDKEIVVLMEQTGEQEFEVETNDLVGTFDDGAKYRIVGTVRDDLGQSGQDELEFVVMWEHQAVEPNGEVEIENYIAKIKPIAAESMSETDKCDIYRLSADRPTLIYKGAEFGTEYVDPYPTIGEHGGYRLVTMTANGDYITADNTYAWLDVEESLDYDGTIIDFGGGQLFLRYGINISHDWAKDFTKTDYLGGAQQGDWNPAVTRKTDVSAALVTLTDADDVEVMRRLADYAGICHIRTADGSNFACDIQVSESNDANKYGKIVTYSLNITEVDSQRYDAMTYEEWLEMQGED